MNKIQQEVRNIVNYNAINIGFTEKNTLTGEVKNGKFKLLDGFEGRVIASDKYVVVIFGDGSKGTAKCFEKDEFSFKRGLNIAFNRALMEHIKKETRKLCK